MISKNEERISITLKSGGLSLFGIMHKPVGLKAYPSVLFCHGFGGNKSGKFRLAVRLAERLAEAGIGALRIDCRGSGDSEGDFAATTVETQLDDLKEAASYLTKQPEVREIGILGRSLGGALGCYLAPLIPQVRSIALWAPVFDCKPWFQGSTPHTYIEVGHEIRFMGELLSKESLKQFMALDVTTPLTLLEKVPMLVVQAGEDELLHSYHHERYMAQRDKAEGATETLFLPHSNHEFDNFIEQGLLIEKTLSFFKKYIQ